MQSTLIQDLSHQTAFHLHSHKFIQGFGFTLWQHQLNCCCTNTTLVVHHVLGRRAELLVALDYLPTQAQDAHVSPPAASLNGQPKALH